MEHHAGAPDYPLGQSPLESQRLIKQAAFLHPATERIFRRAGLGPGMNILDLGCGAGDISFLAAGFAGPTGSVTGIDRNPAIVALAAERARQMAMTNVSFANRSIDDLTADREFDAVVGRFVLIYQPDPVATLAHISSLLSKGGLLIALEPDMSVAARSWPRVPLWHQVDEWIRETFRRGAAHHDVGARLYHVFRQAGLPGPEMRIDLMIGGGDAMKPVFEHCTAIVRSVLPKMEQFGIATAEEVQVDTLAERLEREVNAEASQLTYAPMVAAWTRRPE
jgi:ubiquinone/menaquinone biosynthesis C-methylase UbiE